MCGVAGVLAATPSQSDADQAEVMIASLAHRGPDGRRTQTVKGVRLGHARLSIIDLHGGWQPLQAAGSTIVGNGEIYNYLELIQSFGLADRLSTASDFEPLLHLYAQEGEKAFERLRGMYAFCLVGVDGRSWLVRDPFGIKPLYVCAQPDRVLFASEPRALWRAQRVRPSLDSVRTAQLLTLNYVLDDGPDQHSVTRLKPGAVVEVIEGVATLRTPARPIASNPSSTRLSDAAALGRLDAVLEDAVRVHQRSDVPYGLFLSGGVDSTTLAVLMARLNQTPVKAFTCGFDAPGVEDERRGAERVAQSLGLDWRETHFTEEDFWRLAPQSAEALDDPTSDYACLPTLKLAEAAKGAVRVVLSGEGGDEMFAGYGRYRRALRPRWLGGRPSEPQVDDGLLGPFAKGSGGPLSPLAAWRRDAHGTQVEGRRSILQDAQRADVATWLPKDLLLKLDRCLMSHGLEGRTPFVDREVANFAFSLPDRQKVRSGCAVCTTDAVREVFTDPSQANRRWPLLFYALWWSIHVEGLSAGEAGEAICGAP